MDITSFLNGQQLCFHSAKKHENGVSYMIGCLLVVRIYTFMKEIKLYICALYTIFLFVKSENNNFIKEIKRILPAFIAKKLNPLQARCSIPGFCSVKWLRVFDSPGWYTNPSQVRLQQTLVLNYLTRKDGL